MANASMPNKMVVAVPSRWRTGPIRVEPSTTMTPAGKKARAMVIGDQPSESCTYKVTMNWKAT
jgi:hypothetical protein